MQRVILKADCPVAGLNQIFPNGVPVESIEPTIAINEMPCLAFPLSFNGYCIKESVLEQILTVLRGDQCPIALMISVSTSQIVPIDPDWVASVVEEVPHG